MNDHPIGYLMVTAAFAFFILCPRLGAMTNILERHCSLPIYWIVIIGTVSSIPLLMLMTWLIKQRGLVAGLALAIVTDKIAAAILTSVSMKAVVETFIHLPVRGRRHQDRHVDHQPLYDLGFRPGSTQEAFRDHGCP